MNVLEFLFKLSASFVIFSFIWAIFKFIISAFTGNLKGSNFEYVLRIVKYVLLVAVTANIVNDLNAANPLIQSETARIILGSMVIGLYLLGKLQNKNQYAKFANIGGKFLNGLTTSFDLKTERFMILGAMGLFSFFIMVPSVVDNTIINWFTGSINGLYDAFLIGFIFKVIAFFSLISIFTRGSNIIGKLIQGKPLSESIRKDQKKSRFSQFGGFQNANQNQSNTQTQDDYAKKASMNTDSDGFTDYEDVTDQ